MVALVLVLLFIAIPLAELWLILQVGELIGVWPTIFLLVADSVFGAWLLKSQGSRVWQRFRSALSSGRVPADEAVEGFLVILGGTLLILPGFISDAAGLALILPPTRRGLRGAVIHFLSNRSALSIVTAGGGSETHVRDFARSDQPRRSRPTTGRRDTESDLRTQQTGE